VAAGFDTSPEGDLDAAVWTSKDGSSWTRLAQQPSRDRVTSRPRRNDHGDRPNGFGQGGAGAVDLAHAVVAACEKPNTFDFLTPPGTPIVQQIEAIATNDVGLVAVGWTASGGNADAAVWTSANGSTWERVPVSGVFGGAGDQRMSSVTSVGGHTSRVARPRDGRDPDGAIWLSADGIAWKHATVSAITGAGGQQISSLVSFASNRLLATGSQDLAGDEQAAAWVAKRTGTSP
jgi:hypothetical protein